MVSPHSQGCVHVCCHRSVCLTSLICFEAVFHLINTHGKCVCTHCICPCGFMCFTSVMGECMVLNMSCPFERNNFNTVQQQFNLVKTNVLALSSKLVCLNSNRFHIHTHLTKQPIHNSHHLLNVCECVYMCSDLPVCRAVVRGVLGTQQAPI